MKDLKMIALILSLLSLFMFQSCSQDSAVNNSNNSTQADYVIYDYDFENLELQEATLENDIFIPEFEPLRPDLGNTNPRLGKRIELGKFFVAMKLSEEQKLAIRELMKSYTLCEMQWLRKLQEVRNGIIRKAQEERKSIMEKVRNNELTREEAAKEMRVLNERVKNLLQNHPIHEEVRQGILRCRKIFFDSIAELLTDEQLVIWNRFLNGTKAVN